MSYFAEPGAIVRSADHPEWGMGQVQSRIGERITVNFEHAGKLVLKDGAGRLELISSDDD